MDWFGGIIIALCLVFVIIGFIRLINWLSNKKTSSILEKVKDENIKDTIDVKMSSMEDVFNKEYDKTLDNTNYDVGNSQYAIPKQALYNSLSENKNKFVKPQSITIKNSPKIWGLSDYNKYIFEKRFPIPENKDITEGLVVLPRDYNFVTNMKVPITTQGKKIMVYATTDANNSVRLFETEKPNNTLPADSTTVDTAFKSCADCVFSPEDAVDGAADYNFTIMVNSGKTSENADKSWYNDHSRDKYKSDVYLKEASMSSDYSRYTKTRRDLSNFLIGSNKVYNAYDFTNGFNKDNTGDSKFKKSFYTNGLAAGFDYNTTDSLTTYKTSTNQMLAIMNIDSIYFKKVGEQNYLYIKFAIFVPKDNQYDTILSNKPTFATGNSIKIIEFK